MEEGYNDAVAVLEALSNGDVADVLVGRVRGEWASVVWVEERGELWWGRGGVGQRSLCLAMPSPAHPCMAISSVPLWHDSPWTEVPPGLHCATFTTDSTGQTLVTVQTMVSPQQFIGIRQLIEPPLPDDFTPDSQIVESFLGVLSAAVRVRVQELPLAMECVC